MKKLTLLLFAAILLTACQPAAISQPTAVAPTNPPPPTPTSAPVETLVSSASDLVGIWWFSPPGLKLEFKADGTSRLFFGTEVIDTGNYTFDAGKVAWITSGYCKDKPATYEAYLTKQDGKPLWLRMKVVGSDPCRDRADSLANKGKFLNP
jgi:hypothetical protein